MFLQPEQAEHFKLHHWKEHCNAHFILCEATRISDFGPPYYVWGRNIALRRHMRTISYQIIEKRLFYQIIMISLTIA